MKQLVIDRVEKVLSLLVDDSAKHYIIKVLKEYRDGALSSNLSTKTHIQDISLISIYTLSMIYYSQILIDPDAYYAYNPLTDRFSYEVWYSNFGNGYDKHLATVKQGYDMWVELVDKWINEQELKDD